MLMVCFGVLSFLLVTGNVTTDSYKVSIGGSFIFLLDDGGDTGFSLFLFIRHVKFVRGTTALSQVRPTALVMIETELWPRWIAAAARRGVPLPLKHISEPTRLLSIPFAVFGLKKKKISSPTRPSYISYSFFFLKKQTSI